MTHDAEHLFVCLSATCIFSLVRYVFISLMHFLIKDSLCILFFCLLLLFLAVSHACRILVPQPGIEPWVVAVKPPSPNKSNKLNNIGSLTLTLQYHVGYSGSLCFRVNFRISLLTSTK